MRIKEEFRLESVEAARSLVRTYPFATVVTRDLSATHMPCLVAEADTDGLTVLGHVARADPVADMLDGPVLLVFHGPHGYVSASWYAADTIPTWNYIILHVRGTPEILDVALEVSTSTVCRSVLTPPGPGGHPSVGGS